MSDAELNSSHQNPRRPDRKAHVYFGNRRRDQDEAAHADPAEAVAHIIPDHPLIPRGDAELITTAAALDDLLKHLRDTGAFAYDSEFIGERSYEPLLCVVQVATTRRVALVDALAPGLDLTPLLAMLAEPSVEKVVHAGQQDMGHVVRRLDVSPARVFDVQVGAAFTGLPFPLALNRLVEEFVGVSLPKGLKFSQWDRRPLSARQLLYAANDVRYLPAARAALHERLERAGNIALADAECAAALCDASIYRFDPAQQAMRVKGIGSLRPKNLAVLHRLVTWRDQRAREADVPPRSYLADGVLASLARDPINSLDELTEISGLPRPVREQHGDEILALTLEALAVPPAQRPGQTRFEESAAEEPIVDKLWADVQARCQARGIDPAVTTSRKELSQVFCALRRGRDVNSRLTSGWRRDYLGDLLDAAINAR